MARLDKVLKLGDPKLYKISAPVNKTDLDSLKPVIDDLHHTLMEFKAKYHAGRAIAAPQLGVMKRLIYMYITEPVILINPELFDFSEERLELWDDCMCFPQLLVKVQRHKQCKLKFFNLDWKEEIWELEGDLSELLQHEVDHLNGVLAVQRAINDKSFAWR
ncbi:MAG: peptide deformylase [Deltaproteobacteria bacterium]|nr:peptide deformylase [Deltaproteobacteria bacterium]